MSLPVSVGATVFAGWVPSAFEFLPGVDPVESYSRIDGGYAVVWLLSPTKLGEDLRLSDFSVDVYGDGHSLEGLGELEYSVWMNTTKLVRVDEYEDEMYTYYWGCGSNASPLNCSENRSRRVLSGYHFVEVDNSSYVRAGSDYVVPSGEKRLVRIHQPWEVRLGVRNVDWVPSVDLSSVGLGVVSRGDWAWWNSSCSNKRVIEVSRQNASFNPVRGSPVNVSVTTGGADVLDDFFFVTNVTGSFAEFDRVNITSGAGSTTNFAFVLQDDMSAAVDSRYEVYFNCSFSDPLQDWNDAFAINSSGKLHYYSFDINASNEIDIVDQGSGNVVPFVLDGVPLIPNTSVFVQGNASGDEVNDSVNSYQFDNLIPADTSSGITIEGYNWLDVADGGNQNSWFDQRGSSGFTAMFVDTSGAGGLKVRIIDETGADSSSNIDVIQLQTWQHWALYCDGTTLFGVVDGVTVVGVTDGTCITGDGHLHFLTESSSDPCCDWVGQTDVLAVTTGDVGFSYFDKYRRPYATVAEGAEQEFDNTSPNITFQFPTPPPFNFTNNNTLGFSVKAEDINAASNISDCILTLDGVNFSMSEVGVGSSIVCTSEQGGQSDGVHNYTVFVNDTSGNANTSVVRTVVVDTIVPTITIASPTNTTFNSASVPLNVSNNDENPSWMGYSLDGAANVTLGEVNDSGLVSRWPFGEGSGSSAGDVVGGNNGVINGSSWESGSNCILGNCLSFDGVNDSVVVANSASIQITGDLTILMWIKPKDVSSVQYLLSKHDGGGTNYRLGIDNSPAGRLLLVDGVSPARNSDTTLTADVWQHIAVVVDSGTSTTFYLNGLPDGSPGSATITGDDANLRIGSAVGANHFNGTIDDIRIFNRLLSSTEIGSLYNLTISNRTLLGLSDGAHNVIVSANDSAGNINASQVFFTVDRTPINITVFSPLNETFFTSVVPLTVTVNGEADTWMFSLDGAANVTFVPNTTLLIIQNGSHNIEFSVNLTDGRGINASRTFFSLNFTSANADFSFQVNSSSSVEAFEVFRVNADVNVSGVTPDVDFETPLPALYVFNVSDSTLWGRWTMAFRRGGGADVGFFADIMLPPGDFTYNVVFVASDGASYHTPFFNISVHIPIGLVGGLVTPTRMLAEFVEPSPPNDGSVSVFGVLTVKAIVRNAVNGISTARLLVVDEERNLLGQQDLVVSSLGGSDSFLFGGLRLNSIFTRGQADAVTPRFYYIFVLDGDGNELFSNLRRFYLSVEPMPEGSLDDPCDTIFTRWSAPFMTCMWKRYLIDSFGDTSVGGIRVGYVAWSFVFSSSMAMAGALAGGMGGAMGLGLATMAVFASFSWVPLWVVYLLSIPTALLSVKRIIELLEGRSSR